NAYSITIGISGSSEGTFYSSPCTYRRKDLQPGTYSYTLKKSFSEAACGSGQGVPADVIKSGSFTIVAGEIETVSVGYIN
ncbi:MAG: hypothetical protein HRT71_13130, partial [Flavobacteriales bacterium]|nr:hypothetical protein [Flavobacteriales bacterium]